MVIDWVSVESSVFEAVAYPRWRTTALPQIPWWWTGLAIL